MDIGTYLHNSPHPNRQRHPRHIPHLSPEKPRVRPHSLVRQCLDSRPRNQTGTRLVESDVAVGSDAAEEEVDSPYGFDAGFVGGAFGFEIGSVTVQDVDVLARDVDVREEVGEHEGVVGFGMVGWEVDVFVLRGWWFC